MQFNIERDHLLPMLQNVGSIIERREKMPILSCLLFRLEPEQLTVTATDMEVELLVRSESESGSNRGNHPAGPKTA